MKKLLLGIGMVLMATGAFAQNQDHLKLTADKNIMDAAVGEVVTYTISFENVTDSMYAGFSCDLWLPDNVVLKQYDIDGVKVYFKPVEGSDFTRSFFNYNEGKRTEPERYGGNAGEFYRLIAKTDRPNELYFPTAGKTKDLFTFQARKNKNFADDVCPIYLRLVEFASQIIGFEEEEDDFGEITVVPVNDKNDAGEVVVTTHHFPDTKSIALKVGENKFGTLCINDDLDFSDSEISANVCTGIDDGFVQTAAVEKPAAGTPLILKANAGSYFVNANYGESSAAVSNLLLGTPDAPLTVEGNNTYALAAKQKDGANVVGFYRVQAGVEIPRYKAYINSSADVEGFVFEETTGISNIENAENANQDIYTITGAKVNNAAQKGVYIMNGKKVVVK
ncbi:MAG: hypothetical protein IKX33_00260 [Prevotella sp.]|nr:hypothetical protein [Prevotella sp.]